MKVLKKNDCENRRYEMSKVIRHRPHTRRDVGRLRRWLQWSQNRLQICTLIWKRRCTYKKFCILWVPHTYVRQYKDSWYWFVRYTDFLGQATFHKNYWGSYKQHLQWVVVLYSCVSIWSILYLSIIFTVFYDYNTIQCVTYSTFSTFIMMLFWYYKYHWYNTLYSYKVHLSY